MSTLLVGVVCALQGIKEETQETLMGYIIIAIIIFIVIVIIILAFHQVDKGIDQIWKYFNQERPSNSQELLLDQTSVWVQVWSFVTCFRVGN